MVNSDIQYLHLRSPLPSPSYGEIITSALGKFRQRRGTPFGIVAYSVDYVNAKPAAIEYGWSICSPNDIYDEVKGKMIAESRLQKGRDKCILRYGRVSNLNLKLGLRELQCKMLKDIAEATMSKAHAKVVEFACDFYENTLRSQERSKLQGSTRDLLPVPPHCADRIDRDFNKDH